MHTFNQIATTTALQSFVAVLIEALVCPTVAPDGIPKHRLFTPWREGAHMHT